MHCLLSRRALGRGAPALVLSALLASTASVHAADEFAVTPAQMRGMGITLQRLEQPADIRGQAYPTRVVLPSSQEQVVSAPLAGLVDRVLVGENAGRLHRRAAAIEWGDNGRSKGEGEARRSIPTLKYEPKPLAEPTALDLTQPQWRERILAESDAIRIAEGLLRKAELSAARAKADRIPDLIVGVYTASEAFRNERVLGLSVSIPLSGNYRSERMQQALQEADAARARVEHQKRQEELEIVEAHVEATGGLERWRLASQGLSTTRDSARLTQRAYSLGEADLQTLLVARRQALDAPTAAEQARLEALRWQYQLLIDAHFIWGLADE